MSETLREIAVEVWDALKALLEIHPTIVEELTAEHSKGGHPYWSTDFLFGFELVQYKSMTAAAKAQGISYRGVWRKLELIQKGYWTDPFAKWIRSNPELFGKVVRRFGLCAWPHMGRNHYFVEDVRQETLEAILPLVTHPEVAELFRDRFAALREEIADEKRNVSLHQRRLYLISYLLKETDLERIERLEGVVWPTKETLRQHIVVGDIMQLRIEKLDLSVRGYNCLKKANIQTVSDLVNTTEGELMNIRSFNRKSLDEVKEKLALYNLALKPDPTSAKVDLSNSVLFK